MSLFSPDQSASAGMARREAEPREFHDPLWLIPRILVRLYSMWVRASYPFAALGENFSAHYTCDVRRPDRMRLGNFVTLHKDVWLHAQEAPATGSGPALIIEDRCFIGRRSHISAQNCIHIERDVMLSASVFIGDNDHTYADVSRPIRSQGMSEGGRIRIGQGSWVGQNAVILCEKGELTLGRNCVVAANAVVTRSAPPYAVLSGNPARIVRQFDPVKGAWVLGSCTASENGSSAPRIVAVKEVRA